jgi:copper homeostasis protein
VDTADGIAAAVAGGAARLEVCAGLGLGGLTPSPGMMRAAAGCGVPAFAMIRPRAGDFVWTDAEVAVMRADIAAARAAGLAGVVLGASQPDGRLDRAVLATLVAEAAGLGLTLHRCFDLVPDRGAALETAIALGFDRILTSGGASDAIAGRAGIAALLDQAGGRIGIMPGAGISPVNVAQLAGLGLREVHGSCSMAQDEAAEIAAFGFGPAQVRRTSETVVRALVKALTQM